MLDVISLGELLIDFTPIRLGETAAFQQNAGGAPANVAVCSALMGKHTAFMGKVGKDAFGVFLRQTLNDYGVNTSGLCVSDVFPTTLAFVHLDPSGERSFSFYRHESADVMLETSDLNLEMIKNTKIFHFGSVSMTHDPSRRATLDAVQIAKKAGSLITFDPNIRLPLWTNEEEARQVILGAMEWVDVLKVSDEELLFLTGERNIQAGIAALRKHHNFAAIFVTSGSKGCFYSAPCGEGSVPSFPVQPVDTTGAGDGFMGALISGLLDLDKDLEIISPEELEKILRLANACGALTTTQTGGIPALPSREKVLTWMIDQGAKW